MKKIQGYPMNILQQESGSSILSLVIGSALGLTIMVFAGKVLNASHAAAKNVDARDLANRAKIMLLDEIDCGQTLGFRSPPIKGLQCEDYARGVMLKRADGSPLKEMGGWSILAGCPKIDGKNANEIVVALSKEGVDPLTKKKWSDMETAVDLFQGTSDFCREFFTPDSVEQVDFSEPELDCFWASRNSLGVTTSENGKFRNLVQSFQGTSGEGEKIFGIQCSGRYNRTGCAIRNTRSQGDYDVRYVDRGCYADNEEWQQQATIFMNCCKLKDARK